MDSDAAAPVSPGAGCPIRRPLDRCPSTAPQGFSQSPASFIGPRRPGIPRAPHPARRPPAGAPSRRDRPTPTPTHTSSSLSLSHHSPPVKDLGPDDLWLRARLRQQLPAKNRQLPQGKKIGLTSIRPPCATACWICTLGALRAVRVRQRENCCLPARANSSRQLLSVAPHPASCKSMRLPISGGDGRIRTPDLPRARRALSH